MKTAARARFAPLFGGALAAIVGCAPPPYEARRTYAPSDAATALGRGDGRAWIVRGDARVELPAGARLESKDEGWVVVSPAGADGARVRKLADGDSVVVDDDGRIVAIRAKDGSETRFEPGSATWREGTDEILLTQSAQAKPTPLEPGDRVEVLARYAPGDELPGVGRVEIRRKTSALVAGALFGVLSYAPSAYIGATSSLKADRALLVPVAGPWIDLATRPSCVPPPAAAQIGIDPCIGETGLKAALITSGAVQAIATVLIVLGLPAEAVVVRTDTAEVRVGPLGARGDF